MAQLQTLDNKKRYFVTEIVLTYCEKNCFSGRKKLLKFEADGQEFAKILRSLEQSIQTEQFLVIECFLNLFHLRSKLNILIKMFKNINWNLRS